jgi:hypothetical protein
VGHGPAQERLGRVDDVGVGERGAVGAAALADFLLVEDVDRGAEAVGGLGERDAADGDVAVGFGSGGAGPDGQAVGAAERTGRFRIGGDQPVLDSDGRSRISVEDAAAALIDEAELPRFVQRRFTIGY